MDSKKDFSDDPSRIQFTPELRPNLQLLEKASRHRLGSAKSCPSRCQSSKIKRKNKPRAQSSKPAPVGWGTDQGSTVQGSTGPDRRRDDQGYLSDSDDEMDQVRCWEEDNVSTANQRTYSAACNKFSVKPNKWFDTHANDTELSLKDQGIGPAGTKACAMALTVNRTIRNLDYEGNTAGADGIVYMSDMLTENIFITDLNLANNQMGSIGLRSLVDAMKENDTVQKLNISANGFEERDGYLIAELIKGNEAIRELNLSHNNFREEGGVQIGDSLGDNTCLETLDLSWNHLRRRGAVSISLGLGDNIGLQRLNLSWNGWYLEGCKALSRTLRTNCTLLELDLTCNRIDKKCIDILLQGLRKNESLLTLKISKNPIGREGAVALVHVLEQKPSLPLTNLDISSQPVGTSFITSLERVLLTRPVHVKHGVSLYYGEQGPIDFVNDDPLLVLMEFMRIRNLRLVDLFTTLDTDSSSRLTKREFREGLMAVNIPIRKTGVNRLLHKLDKDGDGEVDLGELIEAQKKHKKRVTKLMSEDEAKKIPFEETEIGSIHIKVKKLLAENHNMLIEKAKENAESRSQFKRHRNRNVQHTRPTVAVPKEVVHETISKVFPEKGTRKKMTTWAL